MNSKKSLNSNFIYFKLLNGYNKMDNEILRSLILANFTKQEQLKDNLWKINDQHQ